LLKSLHRTLECITLAKEFNKLKHKTMTTEQQIDYLCNLLRKSGTHESLLMPNAILLLRACKNNGKKVTDLEII